MLKDRDSLKTALLFYQVPIGLLGFVMTLGPATMAHLPWYIALGIALVVGWLGFILPAKIVDGGAAVGASLYMKSGKSTPAPAQYSLAESLVARGQTDEAIEAYTLLSEDFPDDPEPRIRLARVLRDKKRDYEAAAAWFKKSFASQKMEPSVEIAITRELVEVYTHKLKTPERALPFLSRLTEKYPTHPAATWSRSQYVEIKNDMNNSRG